MALVVFIALMAVLCVLDCKFRVVPNLIVIPAMTVATIAFKTYIPVLMTFGLAMLIYNRGFWCGGDVKLATMVSAFMGFPGFVAVCLSTLLVKIYGDIKNTHFIPTAPFMLVAVIVVKVIEAI